MKFRAVILIGGVSTGTRFRPLSLHTPKPLFPVAGKPLIYHHVKACAELQGMKEIILLGFFKSSLFEDFCRETSEAFGITVKYLQETRNSETVGENVGSDALGTGGGIYHYRSELTEGLDKDKDGIFILNCDVLCGFPLEKMQELRESKGAHGVVLGKKIAGISNVGQLAVNDDGVVIHYAEKPETFVSDMVNCGVYLFSLDIFDVMDSIVQGIEKDTEVVGSPTLTRRVTSSGDIFLRLEQDVLVPMIKKQETLVICYDMKSEFWSQLKHPGASISASAMILANMRAKGQASQLANNSANGPEIVGDVYIDPSATISPSAKLGPNVTIGKNVRVGAGVRIKHSILLDNVVVKDRACIMHSIIGWDSIVGEWCRIEGDISTDFRASAVESTSLTKAGGVVVFGQGVEAKNEIIVRKCIVLPHKSLAQDYKDEIIL